MKYTHCSKYLFNKSIALEISFCALAIVTSLFLANYNGKSLWYQYISKQIIDIPNPFKIRSHHLICPFFVFNQIYIQFICQTSRKGSLWRAFLACFAVSQRAQINFIFNDKFNVCILCLSCNINKSKTTAELSENSWNKRRSICFQWHHLWHQCLYCYRFFLLLYMNQVPEMLY